MSKREVVVEGQGDVDLLELYRGTRLEAAFTSWVNVILMALTAAGATFILVLVKWPQHDARGWAVTVLATLIFLRILADSATLVRLLWALEGLFNINIIIGGPVEPEEVEEEWSYKGHPFDERQWSLWGFYAFCDQFLFRDHDWSEANYLSQDPTRRYWRAGVPDGLARIYLDNCVRAGIIVNRKRGQMGALASSVRSVKDVERRVPYLIVPQKLSRRATGPVR